MHRGRASQVLSVLLADLTKLGTAWSKFINDLTSIISAVIAPSLQTCCIMIAPNRARWGEGDNEVKLNEAIADVEATLRNENAAFTIRRVQIIFEENSLTGSTRPAVHDAWMIVSGGTSGQSFSAGGAEMSRELFFKISTPLEFEHARPPPLSKTLHLP